MRAIEELMRVQERLRRLLNAEGGDEVITPREAKLMLDGVLLRWAVEKGIAKEIAAIMKIREGGEPTTVHVEPAS